VTYFLVGAIGVPDCSSSCCGCPMSIAPRNIRRRHWPPGREFRAGLAEASGDAPDLDRRRHRAVMYLGYGAFSRFLPLYAKDQSGLNDAEIAIVLGSQLATAVVAKRSRTPLRQIGTKAGHRHRPPPLPPAALR